VKVMKRSKVDATLIGFLSNIIYALLLVFVVLAALGQLGVETTSFIAVLGAAGLAVGLALQGSLANFASGVMIILFRPFKAGDFVEIAGVAGIIEEVQIFTCRLRTGDNKAMYIPNGKIMGDNIVNYSANKTRRVDMVFGCGYDDDIRAAKALLHKLVAEDPRILDDPAPTIGVLELGDNSVNFAVRPWVNASDYWPVYFDMHEKVKIAFDEAGLSIPYPQRDVHIHEVKPAA
ncbi:MAG: mechanosensitive ion channel family protein, partial [Gammaproteobacteria bacterium]